MQIFNTINFVHAKGSLKKLKEKHLCTYRKHCYHFTKLYKKPVFWIRIHIDFILLDPDLYWEC